MEEIKVKRVLVSVSNKEGIVDFVKGLKSFGAEIISTGGTAKVLRNAGVEVMGISEVTKFPEMLDGRVKTLHPAIHAGLLAIRDKKEHMEQIEKEGISPIDMVVVNLYPFAETIAKKGVTMAEAVEQIDIGGPSMLRSAAKNFEGVAVVANPERYDEIISEMKKNNGCTSRKTRLELAKEVFRLTAEYDTIISQYLCDKEDFPSLLNLKFEKIQDLRYGENPHQRAAYYRELNPPKHSLVFANKLHGKDLSFNNIIDLDAAWSLCCEFTVPAAVVVKHTNPCGVALADDIATAYEKAHAVDSVSAFGSVVALNRVVDVSVAEKIASTFVEAVIAPAFLEEALEILTKKKNIRLMHMGEEREKLTPAMDIKRVDGGILLQDMDTGHDDRKDMKVVTETKPTEKEWEDLLFAWRVAKHIKSNAILIAKDLKAVGVGAGQMSRVDSSELAIKKAGGVKACKDAVVASDAFFPFRDSIDALAKVGIKAIIQPGGSMRDEEVVAAANEHGIAMIFTGKRHFRH
ncbi:bifunctional phosphoribosylaminoimidazolecarboxamide formyltransferase/IMP cyclohydrolase [Candidatus Oleimmundimicrobium sp.]|uniref:bifunctional phosphoribosylaminoimidazolecarboxamide formyltransferase/IMP cyclohydrolase n=1 Tax=Candidatus Oleimmundimicrobium sp. TaxID=3060597 RepID=UPI00271B0792|nr:bifunctional phosphoribosylaminoimidazolecarboxamide formyltransferase/IMP cyclohydrolase [Candidatus Oleimmundimicrobium sp.]MDO8885616.1 bifunctional phosphoribosylaminoimidazolecarboxamide formyltransferase/IMP cyclohydrolase [Candidatus Oleimmundimicrobium sp.]